MNKDKRYVVTLNVRVFAENDYMARKRAHQLKDKVNNTWDEGDCAIEEIGESPFASLTYRVLDDKSEPNVKSNVGMDLPF
tara:strand:- start:861 stop:1100 length:240 start_codon:yes stop_codon:yes gene_type:complete